MAAVRGKTPTAVGSSEWIQQEKDQIAQFQEQDFEDFVFSARNETEWLNEHMADIFNNTQLNVTEIFKTPGKLRGKTPRTVRKRSPEARAPLTEMFGSNKRVNSSPIRQDVLRPGSKSAPSPKKDVLPLEQQFPPIPKATQQSYDSGYHSGYQRMVEEEMDVDDTEADPTETSPADELMHIDSEKPIDQGKRVSNDERTTEGSFHSARENVTTREIAMADAPEREGTTPLDLPGAFPKDTSVPPAPLDTISEVTRPSEQKGGRTMAVDDETQPAESPDSTVEGSSPAKPLVRKSSLTFASLPAREPLATKKSIGHQARTSNADASKNAAFNRSSYMGRFTGGKSLGGSRNAEEDRMVVDEDDDASVEDEVGEEHTKKLHNKSSTQRLHERINLLGKTQPARPTKSIPSVSAQQPAYPELREESHVAPSEVKSVTGNSDERAVSAQPDEEDDWIMPSAPKAPQEERQGRPNLLKSRSVDVMEHIQGKENISGADFGLKPGESEQTRQQSPLRYHVNAKGMSPSKALPKSASTTELTIAPQSRQSGHQKAISVSNPTFLTESTTPAGSPTAKFHLDGHLSASKSKLQSIMKSAKNLFSSSARVSNQAKMETMSPSPVRIHKQVPVQGLDEIAEVSGSDHPVYPNLNQEMPASSESPTQGRKTRSSTEKAQKKREKEEKERQKAEGELKKAREQERQKATKFQEKLMAPSTASLTESVAVKTSTLEQSSKPIRQSPRRQQNREENQAAAPETKAAAPQPPRPQSQASQIAKPKEIRRPMKPTKDAVPKPKPQPVSIRIGTLGSQRIPLSSSSLASSQQDSSAPPPTKHVVPTKKPSTASQTSASATSFKNSLSSNASKAKAPITRKIERKPTAQEETQKRLQQQREARAAAIEDSKKATQKQTIEQRRLEQGKKEQPQDTQRAPAEAPRFGQNERTHGQAPQRPGFGASRPITKAVETQDFPRPPMSTATQPKRVHDFDQEDELARPARPIPGQNYQPNEAKRRKTDDEETLDQPVRSAMAPPIRQSNIRKDGFKSSMFGGNYPIAPPPASIHAGPSRPPAMVQSHQQQPQPNSAFPSRPAHPMDMAKFTNGKIPFADAPNPPQSAYKTPTAKQRGLGQPTPKTFSPMFQNGENIELSEIESSEEDDSEDERDKKKKMPDWVRTPNMNDILLQQETVDTDAVFGPIQPANLEEWFTKDKGRLHKLRMRTSSANWFGADRLTEDEVKKDFEARQKMSKDGGWSYGLAKLNE